MHRANSYATDYARAVRQMRARSHEAAGTDQPAPIVVYADRHSGGHSFIGPFLLGVGTSIVGSFLYAMWRGRDDA
jgi:homoaconitase/3-isopropylmalate dehydratase large subunit